MSIVAIIILNYNNYIDTCECIESCEKLNSKIFTIIIVDNSSTDFSLKQLQKKYPQYKIISLSENKGYASGNNAGIQFSIDNGFQYVWIINNDVTVDSHSLDQLLINYNSFDNVGFLGSKVLNYYDPKIIDYIGGNFNVNNGDTSHLGRNEIDNGQYNNRFIETDFITGCSLFIKVDVIKKIGLMAEEYFLYCEDIEWSLRAKHHGYSLLVIPSSVVYHKCSSTTKTIKGAAAFYITRNTLFLLEKLHNNYSWLFFRILVDVKRIIRFVLISNYRGCFNVLKGYLFWLSRRMGSIDNSIKF